MTEYAPPPRLAVTDDPPRITVRFPDHTDLTEANAGTVGRDLAALVEGHDRPHLWVDLGHVDLLTSSALGMLVVLNQRVRAAGGRLTLANLRPHVQQVLAVTRLDRVLDVRPAPGCSA